MSSLGKKLPLGNFGTLSRNNIEEIKKTRPKSKKNKKKRRHSLPSMKQPTPPVLEKNVTKSTISVNNGNKKDGEEDNWVGFWINKNGFPIDDKTWDRMWDHVAKIHPDGYNMVGNIRGSKNLPQVPVPRAPESLPVNMPVTEKLDRIQNYMRELQYNHTGTQFFEIKKNRPISGLMDSAKEMIKESLPIKCLEAVILGIYLTNGFTGVERYPLSFKSSFNGNVHRHVVLGIYFGGSYGALGMSRREDLMYKPLTYKTLSDLVLDFESYYNKFFHEVKKVKVGLPVSHDLHSFESITWKAVIINRPKTNNKELIKELDQHAREIRTKARSWSIPVGIPKRMTTMVETVKNGSGSRSQIPSRKLTSSLSRMVKSNSTPSDLSSSTGTNNKNTMGNSTLSRGNSFRNRKTLSNATSSKPIPSSNGNTLDNASSSKDNSSDKSSSSKDNSSNIGIDADSGQINEKTTDNNGLPAISISDSIVQGNSNNKADNTLIHRSVTVVDNNTAVQSPEYVLRI